MDPVDATTITLKMQRFEPSIDIDFANCFFEKGCQLRHYVFWNFSTLFEEATGHRRNAGIRAGGDLGGHLGFAKLFPGALASTQGTLWNRKMAAESLGHVLAVRKTDRLHVCNGL